MKEAEIACLRSPGKLVGMGFYREVYRVDGFAVKVEKPCGGLFELRSRVKELLRHNLSIREKLDFLPKFYGAVLSAVKKGGRWVPAAVTFHEYIQPVSLTQAGSLPKILELIGRAAAKGFVIDVKPSNFGLKGEKVYYLDEFGVGKGPIPPDVFDDLSELLRKVTQLGKRVSRARVQLSKR